jgi:hypothetical protein
VKLEGRKRERSLDLRGVATAGRCFGKKKVEKTNEKQSSIRLPRLSSVSLGIYYNCCFMMGD